MASHTDNNLPQTMKLITQPSPSSQILTLVPSHPLPRPPPPSSSEHHLIHVHAASPCRHELLWELADPHIFPNGRAEPRLPCPEGSGTIVTSAPGTEAAAFKPGDKVFFAPDYNPTGCLAEYIYVRTSELALVPANITLTQAAAVPLSALTAYQGLFAHGGLTAPGAPSAAKDNEDKKLLITGASGSVGAWAVQLASAAGVGHITALSSPSKASLPRSLGATHILNRDDPGVDKYDVIFDTVGNPVLDSAWSTIKPDGTSKIICVGADDPAKTRPDGAGGVAKAEWFLVQPSGSDLAKIAALIEAGHCRPLVDSVYKFDEFEAAFQKVDRGETRGGKVVIEV